MSETIFAGQFVFLMAEILSGWGFVKIMAPISDHQQSVALVPSGGLPHPPGSAAGR